MSFFAYYMGPSQVSFIANYYMGPPSDQFLRLLNGGALSSVSSLNFLYIYFF